MKRYLLICITLCCCILLSAQDKKPWPLRVLHSIKTYIDSSAVRGIDPNYIQVPKKPWAVMLKYKTNDMDLRSTSTMDREMMAEKGLYGELNWESAFKPRSEVSIGAWIGYRGYGLGYSYSLHRSEGRNFSIGATGANYGVNLRIRSFNTRDIEARMWGYDEEGPFNEPFEETETWDDIKVKSAIFDGYYMFNGKRFSYAAAYDQSLIQKRSAGSLMTGLMYYHSRVSYNDISNLPLLILMNDLGMVKCSQASVGFGYAYNWVPAKGWLVSVMAMPMLSFYNKMKTYEYDIVDESGESIYDFSEEEIADIMNGNYKGYSLVEKAVYATTNKVTWNFDARLSVSYNWSRFYLRTYGHYNRFRFQYDSGDSKLTDWRVYLDLGFRF